MRMPQMLRLLTALLALPLAAQAAPVPEPVAVWMLKMSEAARVTNYQGVVIYSGEGLPETETFKVTHRFHNGLERERVQSQTGEPREVEKQGNKTICLLPSGRKMENRPTPKELFPGLNRARLEQIAEVYRFDDLGEARIAGRVCRGLAITPTDGFRYGYEVWADAKTAVPLKMDLRDAQGRLLERMEFAEIEFPAQIPDSAFAGPAENAQELAAQPPTPPPPPARAAFGPQLPPGFRVTLRDSRQVPGKGRVEHWLLSDGLTAVSVFTTQKSGPRSLDGLRPMGALNTYRRVSGSMQITVVGEVPAETVRQIGDGLNPQAAE